MKLENAVKVPEKMWEPPQGVKTQLDAFRSKVNKKYKSNLISYSDLWKWSTENYASFWEEFWEFSQLIYSKLYTQVVDQGLLIADIPEWFHGSRLNYAENLLRGVENNVALYEAGEGKTLKRISFGDLRERVKLIACALRKCGVQEGDRVVGYVPNCALAVEAMLATASLGAVWSSTSPEFGVTGVLDRFQQIKPKIIFSVDAVVYNGKVHDHMQKLTSVVEGLPDLERVIVQPYVKTEADIDVSKIRKCMFLSEFVQLGDAKAPLEFVQVPFNHPLFIMYSSGTTGPPKCMVHSVGGTLIQHLKEHMLQGDMKSTDIMLYYTTTGWMMWNWMVSCLAIGSAIVLYDGSPLLPTANVLWDLVDEIEITILGTGARWIEALEERGVHPAQSHKLCSLHTILSTGSPLKPASYSYVYTKIKKDLMLGSISGGTDIISCFAGQNKTLPVYQGEIQCTNLGMAVESWNENGQPVFDESGELVCTKPFPSMPTRFWNDPDGKKYNKSYFEKFDGVWAHGDFCQISSVTGGILMLGRSDGTLNPSGVRFGSAEIYNIVSPTNFPEISDSLCVGQNTKQGERVVLFLKMQNGQSFGDELVKKVKTSIRMQLSARHVPSLVLEIKDIPYTASGKKVEVAVKRILNGEHITHRGAFINPNSLDLYYNIPELSSE